MYEYLFIYRVHQAECVIHMLEALSQEYVNIYSTTRLQKRRRPRVNEQ